MAKLSRLSSKPSRQIEFQHGILLLKVLDFANNSIYLGLFCLQQQRTFFSANVLLFIGVTQRQNLIACLQQRKRSINPVRQDDGLFQVAGANAGEQFHGSSAS